MRDFTVSPELPVTDLYRDILEAHAAIRPQVLVTPLDRSAALSAELGCEVFLKADHLQPTGSFKIRGATNKLRKLGDTARRGVVTASTGNHGQAVALAGARLGAPVTVYVAASAAAEKVAAIRALGAELVTVDGSSLEAELQGRAEAARRGVPYVPPYNDLQVMAGQGTIGVELLEQQPDLDAVFISVGGGGLIGGAGTAIKAIRPATQVVGVWPTNSAALAASLDAGRIVDVEEDETLSDGTAGLVEPGAVTFPVCQAVIDRQVLCSEAEIATAMRRIGETERWMVEGSAGLALAGLMARRDDYRGKKVAVVLCGRNISLKRFVAAVG
jgi:threonine dehydratase